MNTKITQLRNLAATALALAGLAASPGARADEVTDWNDNMLTAILTARVGAAPTTRVTAMVQSAVFDAVNGVYKRYTPVHVPPQAPPGTSARSSRARSPFPCPRWSGVPSS